MKLCDNCHAPGAAPYAVTTGEPGGATAPRLDVIEGLDLCPRCRSVFAKVIQSIAGMYRRGDVLEVKEVPDG